MQCITRKKIFEILLNRFGSGVQRHQAMMRFDKRRQREDETTDKLLDDFEMLKRRNQPDESKSRMIATEIHVVSVAEASYEIRLLQKQSWLFQ